VADRPYADGAAFHQGGAPIYSGPLGWAVNKRSECMAHVVYAPAHENAAEQGLRRGRGKDFATWVFCEERGKAEGLLQSGLELVIDARLEPGAAVGLHVHAETEEIYYLLEGALTMTTRAPDGREHEEALRPGDAHLVKVGQAHAGVAGPAGARFLVVAARVPDRG
jgi:quercetin dioxygenase-like cupin family protein